MFWIAHTLVLGGLIYFLSGDDEVNWQNLVILLILIVVPGQLVAFLVFGDAILLRSLTFFGLLFLGLSFFLKVQFPKAGLITGLFFVYLQFAAFLT